MTGRRLLLIPVVAAAGMLLICTAHELWTRHCEGLPIGWQPKPVTRRQPTRIIGGDNWYGGKAS